MEPTNRVSVIVPTIGRPESLARLLDSLASQTHRPDEIIIADGSSTPDTERVAADPDWRLRGLNIDRVKVHPPNAVRQRQAAIALASGEYLLLLDDDVALEKDCLAQMLRLLQLDTRTVAVFADFNNQSWPMPTRAWRLYLRWILRMPERSWQGRVVGPLLRFGFHPIPSSPTPMEWLGAGNSLIRRSAYAQAGGFSDFFLHRCTMNEDVDLGLKLSRVGRILFCPTARMGHFHAPSGRARAMHIAEDDLCNRYSVLHRTMGRKRWAAFRLVLLYFLIETTSNFAGGALRGRITGLGPRLVGRARALCKVMLDMAKSA